MPTNKKITTAENSYKMSITDDGRYFMGCTYTKEQNNDQRTINLLKYYLRSLLARRATLMNQKKYILLMICALAYFTSVNAMPLGGPLVITGTGNYADQLKEIKNGKHIQVYSAGGFVNIKTAHEFPSLSYRTYFKEKGKNNSAAYEGSVEAILLDKGTQIYLEIGKEFCVEVMDHKADTMVNLYTIKRLKVVPIIELTLVNGAHRKVVPITAFDNYTGKVTISAGEIVNISANQHPYFENLAVEYTLINLKTKKIVHKVSNTGFGDIELLANTSYQLSYSYVLQPENVGNYYIEVKPRWYQSIITYVAILVIVAILCILAITYVFKRKIKISKGEQEKMEQAAIRLQSLLNPHFTFNALSTIQGLMNTNRIEEANHYLEEFSSLLRKTLAKSHHIYNSLDQELEMMRMYLNLEALRFNFTWDIAIDEHINPTAIEIPTLLLQPLIENAIKHGLANLGEKGHLVITCSENEKKDTFIISVKDNGTWINKGNRAGYGLSLTAERIHTINQLKTAQTIELTFDRQDGTTAILTFNNWIN